LPKDQAHTALKITFSIHLARDSAEQFFNFKMKLLTVAQLCDMFGA